MSEENTIRRGGSWLSTACPAHPARPGWLAFSSSAGRLTRRLRWKLGGESSQRSGSGEDAERLAEHATDRSGERSCQAHAVGDDCSAVRQRRELVLVMASSDRRPVRPAQYEPSTGFEHGDLDADGTGALGLPKPKTAESGRALESRPLEPRMPARAPGHVEPERPNRFRGGGDASRRFGDDDASAHGCRRGRGRRGRRMSKLCPAPLVSKRKSSRRARRRARQSVPTGPVEAQGGE